MGAGRVDLDGYRTERGILWPAFDKRCAEVTFNEVDHLMPVILAYVENPGVAVQAGGNCGQLVRLLAKSFGAVYTFEPDPRNFVALAVNTAELSNVIRFQAALGCEKGTLKGLVNGDHKHPDNCGAWYMGGQGLIPTLAIDDLALPVCNLLALDIEGSELASLKGAVKTIKRCRPVIVIEDKGLGAEFYGEKKSEAAFHLVDEHGYKMASRIKNDTVLIPA